MHREPGLFRRGRTVFHGGMNESREAVVALGLGAAMYKRKHISGVKPSWLYASDHRILYTQSGGKGFQISNKYTNLRFHKPVKKTNLRFQNQ